MRKVVICATPPLDVGARAHCEFVCLLFSGMCYVLILCVFFKEGVNGGQLRDGVLLTMDHMMA